MTSFTHLALAATALLVTACASDTRPDDLTATVDAGQTNATRFQGVRTSSTPVVAVTPAATSVPAPARVAVRVADQLQQYLARVLGESTSRESWQGHIRRVTVGLHTAAIHTDLSSADDDRITAEQICLVASWFKLSPEGRHITSLDVEVYGHGGHLLATHNDTPAGSSNLTSAWLRRATATTRLPADRKPLATPARRPPNDGHRES